MNPSLSDCRYALGRALSAHRNRRGWTQQKLAEALGRDRSSIAHTEAGQQTPPRAFWLRADHVLGAGGELVGAYQQLAHARDAAAVRTSQSGEAPEPPQSRSLGDTLIQVVSSWSGAAEGSNQESTSLPSVEHDALNWLLSSVPSSRIARARGWRTIGRADIERLTATRIHLKDIDNALGGGAALPMALAYLRNEVPRLLDGQYPEAIGKQLICLVAEMTLDVGWMAYDCGHQVQARHHMLHALRLSQAADDNLFGARVAVALTHQALHLGRGSEAVTMAGVARQGVAHHAPRTALAMAAAMEACAHAAVGDEQRCMDAIQIAESSLARAEPGETDGLTWLEFDEGGLAGHAARAWRDLKKPKSTIEFGTHSLSICQPSHGRTRAQRKAILATAFVHAGDYDRAAALGLEVIEEAWRLHSAHVRSDVKRLAALVGKRRSKTTRTFLARATELDLLSA